MTKFKDLPDDKKMFLVYSGELLVFSLVFIILGVLKIVGTISYDSTRRMVFNYITLAGAAWGYVDFIWAMASPKRKAKSSIIDKCLTLPLATFMIIFDIFCLATDFITPQMYNIMLGAAILYGAAMLLFEAIYHYFNPVPSLIEEYNKLKEEEDKEKLAKQEAKEQEEKKE